MSKLTEEARGRECQVRLMNVCNFNPETTVLSHLNMSGISGRGIKAPDQLGCWSCSACHSAIDSNGASVGLERDFVKLAHLEAIVRTQYILIKEGKLK